MSVIPASHLDLLERPLFGHLATLRPDGTPQVNPVWYRWDGELLWFTTTTTRFKYRNLKGNPNAALSVNDPERPYRYLEVRGTVERIEEDHDAVGFLALAHRYDPEFPPPGDAPDRMVVGIRPHHTSCQ